VSERPVYLSFFMFDTNTQLFDPSALARSLEHMRVLTEAGYSGYELHIGRTPEFDSAFPTYEDEIAGYRALRQRLDDAGLPQVTLATNVGATPELDPSSADPAVRDAALAFLKSRVDITAALGGEIMMGPVVIPYGWPEHHAKHSDALQKELTERYRRAAPVLDELGTHADTAGVKVAIEPITHWETIGPNTLGQTMDFLDQVEHTSIGVVIDSAHETLDGAGPEVFATQVAALSAAGRLHYVQASPPDRRSLVESWLPWQQFFTPVLAHYDGPVAIEIFNAIPAFADGLRLSRREYWIPGVNEPTSAPSAYDAARDSLAKLRREFSTMATP
jgi:sugar phosphate isomerase/epimerase